ncbi:hypothetical protein KK141_11260 [Dyella sp. LX-66]|uniref:hypothetical protein n=1 Tax=unclassified Dyella TaxID=2634549 RepID=UPI001BE0919C|nr:MULTISPECIES: hypothetical protein [unclassified Dyella]MBT2118899.1 hypothetical protein [Dyella sp. LX-1]MBT2140108.1 hypothetical protein [Dyella sp. LX-66]
MNPPHDKAEYETGEQALNAAIMEHPWMDFYLVSLDETHATVRGTLDISCGYQLQIEFIGVGFIDCPVSWKSDTGSMVFSSPLPETLPVDARQRFFDNNRGDVYRFTVEGFHGPWFAHIVAEEMRFLRSDKLAYLPW